MGRCGGSPHSERTAMKRLSLGITAVVAGLSLALVGALPANAVTITFPYRNCATGKVIKTTSYAKYTVTHTVQTGGGALTWSFANGSAYVTNNKSNWGISLDLGGNASGLYVSTASSSCV